MTVTVIGGQQLRDLARDLRRQENGRARTAQLRKELTAEARPLVPLIRGNIRAMQSGRGYRGRPHPPLRRELARVVTLQVRTSGRGAGVAVFMNPRKMPDKKKGLPQYFERTPSHTLLRHPLFGDRQRWYRQDVPGQGYFTKSLNGVEERTVHRIAAVVERTAREIENGHS